MAADVDVHRLRIRGAAALAGARSVPARVEDALRCAALPARWRARIVLLRRLRLRLPADGSSQQLAAQIESEWQRLAALAVPADRADAAEPAVWFDDEPSARLALIARLARHADCSAWYWQRLLAGAPASDLCAQLAALLARPWSQGAPAQREQLRFAAEALHLTGDRAAARRVLAQFDEATLARVLPLDAVAEPGPAPVAGLPDVARATAPLLERAQRWLDRLFAAANGGDRPGSAALGAARRSALAAADHVAADHVGAALADIAAAAAVEAEAAADGWPTGWAGLLFVLNLWSQRAWPPQSPAEAVAWLDALADRLRIPAGDGIRLALDALRVTGREEPVRPLPWIALRRAALALTRRPLRRIAARPGRLRLTRTQLSITLPLATVDLRLRRAALDVDPGWSALLGRVVRFHYD
jgi:hypothetical protein